MKARDRTVNARHRITGEVLVRIGGRMREVPKTLAEARAILDRMGRQPALLIWRALGVEA